MADRTRNDSIIIDIENTYISTDDHQFVDGHACGFLSFYDTRHRPPLPLSVETIREYLFDIIIDPQKGDTWKAGALAGWIQAVCENSPQTFTSILVCEQFPVGREV